MLNSFVYTCRFCYGFNKKIPITMCDHEHSHVTGLFCRTLYFTLRWLKTVINFRRLSFQIIIFQNRHTKQLKKKILSCLYKILWNRSLFNYRFSKYYLENLSCNVIKTWQNFLLQFLCRYLKQSNFKKWLQNG